MVLTGDDFGRISDGIDGVSGWIGYRLKSHGPVWLWPELDGMGWTVSKIAAGSLDGH